MKKEFKDIIAACKENNHCSINLEEYDSHENCIVSCNISLYGIPQDISDENETEIYDGNFDHTVSIGTLRGSLILCKQIFVMEESVYEICDDISGDLEFAISVLQGNGGPLNEETGDEFQDVFYIDELEILEQYNSVKLKVLIINSIPQIIFSLYHVCADILAYYPRSLPYEEDLNKKIKKDMATIVARDKLDRKMNNGNESESDFQLVLDEEQVNYILGRRNESDSYPEPAKDKPLWNIYQKAGFVEIGKSRLLFKFGSL